MWLPRYSRAHNAGIVLCCAAAVGCGGSGSHSPPAGPHAAQRVCGRAGVAAHAVLGDRVLVHVANHDPANIECLLHGSGADVDLIAQASSRAWTQYDTTVVHFAQAFGSGSGVNKPGHLPQGVHLGTANASWVPAQQELVATNATESTGGSYLTVTVTHLATAPALRLALAIAKAALATAPRGPNPGPPPS